MRDILFRGKDVESGKWLYGWVFGEKAKSIIELDTQYVSEEGVEAYYTSVVIPETVGQYTGLDDKNSVKIFEGDIVREHVNDYTPIYQNGIYMAYNVDKINDPYVSTQFNVIWRNGCEVISNIHDNVEPMEG